MLSWIPFSDTKNTLSDEKLVKICSRVETSPRKSIVGFLSASAHVSAQGKKTTAFTCLRGVVEK